MPCFKVGMWWMVESERRKEATFGRIAAPKKRIFKSATTLRRGRCQYVHKFDADDPHIIPHTKSEGETLSLPVPSPASEMTCIPPFFFAACSPGWAEMKTTSLGKKSISHSPTLSCCCKQSRPRRIHPSSAFFSHLIPPSLSPDDDTPARFCDVALLLLHPHPDSPTSSRVV